MLGCCRLSDVEYEAHVVQDSLSVLVDLHVFSVYGLPMLFKLL